MKLREKTFNADTDVDRARRFSSGADAVSSRVFTMKGHLMVEEE
jgi:hypothetical protein